MRPVHFVETYLVRLHVADVKGKLRKKRGIMMENQDNKISKLSDSELMTRVGTKLDTAVWRLLSRKKAAEHLHRLLTKEGDNTIRAIAEIIVADGEQTCRPTLVTDRQMKALEFYIASTPSL